jgi:hypothetical protein
LNTLRESGCLEHIKVLEATTVLDGVIAASAACSIAEACDEDILLVVDSMRGHNQLWKAAADELMSQNESFDVNEESTKQRAFYAQLTERAGRRKGKGSVTLILLQPSVSMLSSQATAKEAYTLSDFETEGFTQTVCSRVRILEERGIKLTPEVLLKLGIPVPGSDHPVAGKGQRSQQHLEELSSLADGHIDLREKLASQGRVPPIDPANSLTRIGIGTNELLNTQTPAMAAVSTALRLSLAQADALSEEKEARRAKAYVAVLQQPDPEPLPLGEQVALVQAATSGALDGPISQADDTLAAELLRGLLNHIRSASPELMSRVSEKGLLSDSSLQRLNELTKEYLKRQTAGASAAEVV